MFISKWKASGQIIIGAVGVGTSQTIDAFERITGLKWNNEIAQAVLIEPLQSEPCYICGNPAVASVNITRNAASTVPSMMKPVCEKHR